MPKDEKRNESVLKEEYHRRFLFKKLVRCIVITICFSVSVTAQADFRLEVDGMGIAHEASYATLGEAEMAMRALGDSALFLELSQRQKTYTSFYQSYKAETPIDPTYTLCYDYTGGSNPGGCYPTQDDAVNAFHASRNGSKTCEIEITENGFFLHWYHPESRFYYDCDHTSSAQFVESAVPHCPDGYIFDDYPYWRCYNNIQATITANFPSVKNLGNPAKQCPSAIAGNPINIAVGNKFEWATDYKSERPRGLRLERFYNSVITDMSSFGHWRSNYNRELLRWTTGTIYVHNPDGTAYKFNRYFDNPWTVARSEKYLKASITQVNGDDYVVNTRNDIQEYYTYFGERNGAKIWRLVEVRHRDGYVETLTYDSNLQLDKVTNTLGETLDFSYEFEPRLQRWLVKKVEGVSGKTWAYFYDDIGNLTEVTYPDGTSVQYHYEDTRFPGGLTGVTDKRGNRFSVFGYDAEGRADLSYHAGNVGHVDVAYNEDGTTTVTNSRGHTTTYTFTDTAAGRRVQSVSGPGCATCGP